MSTLPPLPPLSILKQKFESDISSFASTPNQTFKVVQTVSSTPTTTPPSPTHPISPLSTLYILDSSFNPPTVAHRTIALKALQNDPHTTTPARLLFLLATQNADKQPKPASFPDRLVMMTIMAHDLLSLLHSNTLTNTNNTPLDPNSLAIDIGITSFPFFMDKAASIDSSAVYDPSAQQVHCTGYDTIIRIFNSKYYPADRKLGVLEPFLSRHRLRVCYREGEGAEGGGNRAEQDAYVQAIGDGSREHEGCKREWRGAIELVDDASEVRGLSSTRARKAAVDGKGDELVEVLGEQVARYVLDEKIYDDGPAQKSYD